MRAILCAVVLVATAGVAAAQPTTGDTKPDYARAAEIYRNAETAMAAGKYDDAARDYQGAYDITQDPVLFYKIASAYQKGGKCPQAIPFYKRYLDEGKPTPEHRQLASDQLSACERAAAAVAPPPRDRDDDDSATPSLAGSRPSRSRGMAWISLGVGIALGTVGAVAAMSAEAAEKDLEDLYDTRISGRPVPFNDETRDRYDELVSQGERYETISWVAFGVGGAALVGAGVLFWMSRGGDEAAEAPPVTLRVGPEGGAVSTSWSF